MAAGARDKLYLAVASASPKPVLIDSSKHYLEAVSLFRAAPDRTKIVLLVRDGPDRRDRSVASGTRQ